MEATAPYYIGQCLEFDHFKVNLVPSPFKSEPDSLRMMRNGRDVAIAVGHNVNMTRPSTWRTITRAIEKYAETLAPVHLLDEARSLAASLGRRPMAWRIGRGHRVLGTCDAHGVVTLSRTLMFMPAELRRYVICHELAHLSELNHSPRFHDVCNTYLDGREKELIARLKAFRWPVFY